jgi:phosphatidylserine decarboxylase
MTASDGPAIRVRDRASGRIETERVFQVGLLRFFYGHPAGRLLERAVLSRPLFSRLYARRYRARRAPARIADFAAELAIDPSELERPLDGYRSFDELFTRRLRPGSRPVDASPDRLLSPADARLLVAEQLDGGVLPVKGAAVTVDELVGDATLAARYHGGVAYVLRLAVADLHRFHFPDGGIAEPTRTVAGPLHSVHPIALGTGVRSFANKRVLTLLHSDGFGDVLQIEIGALTVGTIEQTHRPGRVERGVEKGTFHFGGSTIVLLVEPGRVIVDADLMEHSSLSRPDAIETRVRVGTAIGRRAT